MARAALPLGAVALLGAVPAAAVLRGGWGALSAAGAILLVVGNFALTGVALDRAARIGPAAVQAVALGGFLLKIVALAVAIVLLDPLEVVDGPVLAITTAVVTILLLGYEVRWVSGRASVWWLTDREAR